MRTRNLLFAGALALLLAGTLPVFAQGNGRGRGRGHNKDKDDAVQPDNGDRGHGDVRYYYRDDRDDIHAWYVRHESNLPPGLAKKDRLPPGLEKQLIVRGHLPPGLEKKIEPVPVELVRELPPPPPDCKHVIIGGHLVLLNTKTFVVVDVFHFEF
ncbi:MAG TPA: hypothetical protein VJS43_17980 [Candidatus Acidoferrales bacterium]|nr:hypothetical protein [Candidatus Acidoferrales bacterium]